VSIFIRGLDFVTQLKEEKYIYLFITCLESFGFVNVKFFIMAEFGNAFH